MFEHNTALGTLESAVLKTFSGFAVRYIAGAGQPAQYITSATGEWIVVGLEREPHYHDALLHSSEGTLRLPKGGATLKIDRGNPRLPECYLAASDAATLRRYLHAQGLGVREIEAALAFGVLYR